MKKYDVLDIAIKILGLSLVPNAIYWIGEVIILIPVSNIPGDGVGFDNLSFFSYLVGAVFYLIPISVFLFGTKWILTKILKLHQEDPEVDISINRSAFIEIALVIIGGITLIKNIPGFITLTIQRIQINKLDIDMPDNTFQNSWIYRDGSEILLAILFIVYAKPLGQFFAKRAAKSNTTILPNE